MIFAVRDNLPGNQDYFKVFSDRLERIEDMTAVLAGELGEFKRDGKVLSEVRQLGLARFGAIKNENGLLYVLPLVKPSPCAHFRIMRKNISATEFNSFYDFVEKRFDSKPYLE